MNPTVHFSGSDPDGQLVAALIDAADIDLMVTVTRNGRNGSIEIDPEDHPEGITLDTLNHYAALIESVGLTLRGFGPASVVNAVEIAARTNRTPQSVHQLINAERGPGGFPPELNPGSKSPVWDWAAVAAWFGIDYGHTTKLADTANRQRRPNIAA